jgi:hypothetical protein
LCDKLTIVKLKQWHSSDADRLSNLSIQERLLAVEIDDYMAAALSGQIPSQSMVFAANKVFPKEGNPVRDMMGSLGELVSELAKVNCDIWHVQEKVYRFEEVPSGEKDSVIKQLAILNLERSACSESIDKRLLQLLKTTPRHAAVRSVPLKAATGGKTGSSSTKSSKGKK